MSSELEIPISKDSRIAKIMQENQISKEVNQTLIKLLKLKNLQIKTLRIAFQNSEPESDENVKKFQKEEEKLLAM